MLRFLLLLLTASTALAEPKIQRFTLDKSRKIPDAAIVESASLLHTGQIMPSLPDGVIPSDAVQVLHVFEKLKTILRESDSSVENIVRLNVHVKDNATWQLVLSELVENKVLGKELPPITVLQKNIPHSEAAIAIDAVAVAREVKNVEFIRVREIYAFGGAAGAILPPGPRAYVAGQAEKGASPAEATRKTLESLRNTLKFIGLNDSHVVQCKCFLTPITARKEVIKEFEAHFGAGKVPPLVFVEWKSALPIEIELIAHAPAPKRKAWDEIDYFTPPGMTASPVYSRVARIHCDKTIYIGSLFSKEKGDGKAQVEGTFANLSKLLDMTGSDLRHLVKATYYVSNDDCSKSLNELRLNFYDKHRPPSASKAMVADVGIPERGLSIDMIAVPSSIKQEGKPEAGHGLSAEQVREGWISVFDGKTTFGWEGSKLEKDTLVGGQSTTTFANARFEAEFARGGTIKIGNQVRKVEAGAFRIRLTEGKGPIVLGENVALKSMIVRFDEMKSIFPGENLDGWKRIDRATTPEEKRPKWAVKNGIVEAVGGPGALEYPTLYGNAVIQVEVRSRNRHANGGLFFRSIPGDFMNGYEAQIHSACTNGDPSKPAEYATGGIDDRQNARQLVSRDFEPFVMTVLADGPHIATWVNGYQVTDWTDTRKEAKNPRQGLRVEPGTIQLQAHDPASDLEFRAVRVVELK